MKLTTNVIIQMAGIAVQGLNQVSPMLSDRGKFWVSVVVGAIQLGVAVVAHFHNTDGTSQKVAYVK